MKKFIVLVLALAFVIAGPIGCGETKTNTANTSNTKPKP